MARKARNPGVGRGKGERTKKQLVCVECQAAFESVRSNALRCPGCRRYRHAHQMVSYEVRHSGHCPDCGKPVTRKSGRCQKCASKYRSANQPGAGNANWKGGRTINDKGYIMVLNPDKSRRKSNYVGEHILVWEAAHGPEPKGGHIHHLNGEKQDNRSENLQWMSISEHHSSKGYEPYEARIRELEERLR